MDIHEYQAKELLSKFGVPIPRGGVAYSPEQATYRAAEIGGNKWVVKAQIHSGARGKAGGIKLCKNDEEIVQAAEALLGNRLITPQTSPAGSAENWSRDIAAFVLIMLAALALLSFVWAGLRIREIKAGASIETSAPALRRGRSVTVRRSPETGDERIGEFSPGAFVLETVAHCRIGLL